jgi:hypothetical protein
VAILFLFVHWLEEVVYPSQHDCNQRSEKMLRKAAFSILTLGIFSLVSPSQATTLSGYAAGDDAFTAYLSTDPNTLGTVIGGSATWWNPTPVTGTLLPGQNYYLQIVAANADGAGGFLGQFALGDTNFQFANGSQALLTDTANWMGNLSTGLWTSPTGTVVSQGGNSDADTTTPWYGVRPFEPGITGPDPHTIPNIGPDAQWIWPSEAMTGDFGGACTGCTVNLETEIFAVRGVPEPATWVMMILGFAGVGFMAYRRKLKPALMAA